MAPKKETVLKLTVSRHIKAGVESQKYHDYATHDHAAKAAIVQKRHGALRVAQYHTPPITRNLLKEKLPWIIAAGWTIDDHDFHIAYYVRTLEQVEAIVGDPDFKVLMGEEVDLQDPGASLCCGWEEVYVDNGEIVNIENGKSAYGTWEERSATGQS